MYLCGWGVQGVRVLPDCVTLVLGSGNDSPDNSLSSGTLRV